MLCCGLEALTLALAPRSPGGLSPLWGAGHGKMGVCDCRGAEARSGLEDTVSHTIFCYFFWRILHSSVFIGQKQIKTVMKLGRLFAIIAVALSCALFSSCTKEEIGPACDKVLWTGTYPSRMLNNDTKEWEELSSCISLQFCHVGL